MINYHKIIDTFYSNNNKLRDILVTHSTNVAEMAMEIIRRHPELCADSDFTYAAAMLHDIGIIECNAPGIECYGKHEYICHGTLGATMLRANCATWGITENEIEPYARVCERHTGTGLTYTQIIERELPLLPKDYIPETIEEQIICYADKFFSKSRPQQMKTVDGVIHSLRKFGEDGINIFCMWHEKFGI